MKEYIEGSEAWLRQAWEYYSGSLSIIENLDTRYNYDLVQQLLEENMEQEEEQEKQDERQDQQEWKSWEQEEEQSPKTWSWSRQKNSGEVDELSEEEKQTLKEMTEKIKREQSYNQQFFNKAQQKSGFQSAYDTFFWNINRWGEKDW